MPNPELSPTARQDKPFIEARGKAAIIKYLTNNQPNLFCTILGFKKGWRKAKSNENYFSFLIYYSHETGRIERYLFNSGSKTPVNPVEYVSNNNPNYSILKPEQENKERIIITNEELDNYLN